ncbi:MAG: ABC transporter substrate-binding protein [Deltaproteobacteria bacterium]|nr:ABC transporter substrate-binding protein [Deltaproteobacteria bacterium]
MKKLLAGGPMSKAFFSFLGLAGLVAPTADAQKVRTAIPRATLNYLSVQVADAKGFFGAEGLENETLVIVGSTAIAALVSGGVDYSGAGGSGMRAAVRGAPIKAIMFQTEKVTWFLVTRPEIVKVSDLKGKKVAVGTIGDSQDTLVTMLIEREGLSARDITRVAMPSRSAAATFLALKAGAIHAAMLNGDEALLAEREGFRSLTFIGDLFPYPFHGFLTTDKKIAENPGEVRRWLKAMIRALLFIREKPEEAADIAMKKLPLHNMTRPMLLEGIRRFNKALPEGIPGIPSPQGLRNIIDLEVRAPLKMRDEISPETIFNLRFASNVKEELESKR